ncbi:MAG: peptidyl-prolyl cis-trans isomerase [Ignavibacteriae bacterium]|nr:peptidyl-prolyl cis-trans isomerase [Ignavibacteriota bacterium]
MRISKKFINLKLNKTAGILFLLLVLFSCTNEREELNEPIAAKVGSSSLSVSELDSLLGYYKINEEHREEFIRRWIERELLFKEAIEKGIKNSKEYQLTAEVSNKELAAALFIKDYFNKNKSNITQSELRSYYKANPLQFSISENAVVVNYAGFNDLNDAVEFRSTLFNSGWNYGTEQLKKLDNITEYAVDKLFLRSELPTAKVVRVLENLLPGEISIVFESEPNIFAVVQLVDKLKANSIPKFNYIESEVRERYSMMKKKLAYSDFIKELYSKYNVEINRDK